MPLFNKTNQKTEIKNETNQKLEVSNNIKVETMLNINTGDGNIDFGIKVEQTLNSKMIANTKQDNKGDAFTLPVNNPIFKKR
jgi:hypothetical protein